ncbi:hypothetical protein [Pseudomonas sp. NPDC087817]|uniref:hypothetical protein n=1 Tax=Pseudomonas sp. NPDC087817 TaxID=3364451 RepID=UPI003817BE96
MSEKTKASGRFNLRARENGGEEIVVPTKIHSVELSSNSLTLRGWNYDDPNELPWGCRIDIRGPIKVGKYDLAQGYAFYNPRKSDESWMATEGEFTLDEVDFEKYFIKGSFRFTAVPIESPGLRGDIHGTFSLQEYTKPVV